MINFDSMDVWTRQLSDILRPIIGDSVIQELRAQTFEYVEDAQVLLFKLSDRDQIIGAVLEWIQSDTLAAYHGSRLTDAEASSIRSDGLRPLATGNRVERINRALSGHPRWPNLRDRLGSVLESHGKGERAGRREGQVHLTLSRSGLIHGFNHYLQYGSEFDQHVAYALLGQEGIELLGSDGNSRIIKVEVPGKEAIQAAHPNFSVDDMRIRGEVPNLIGNFINAWSYRLSNPSFPAENLQVDSGMVFKRTVPGDWVVEIEIVENLVQ